MWQKIAGQLTSGGGPQQPIEHSNLGNFGLVCPLDGSCFPPSEGEPSGVLPFKEVPKLSTPTRILDIEKTTDSNFYMPSIEDLANLGLGQ